jgi:hypothetical protein
MNARFEVVAGSVEAQVEFISFHEPHDPNLDPE